MKVFLQSLPLYFRQAWAGAKSIKQTTLSSFWKVFSLMGKKEKIVFFSLLAAAAVAFLWAGRNFYYAATVPAPALGGNYTEGFLGQANYLNPVLAHDENDLSLNHLIFSGLYKYDGQGNLVPDLADGFPKISEDQKQYTVSLKKNVQWHSGKEFKADDVVFTVATIKDPNFKSPLRSSWASTGVEKIDDFTVKFTTKEVSGPFINYLTLPILPVSVWSKVAAQNFPLSELNLKAVGTGPYAVSEIKKLSSGKIQSITLESFSNYYAGKPKIDSLTVKFYDQPQDLVNALHSGEIDGFGYSPFDENISLKEESDLKIWSLPLPQYQVIFFNLKNPALADQKVRAALSALIPRQDIVERAFGGHAKPVSSLFSFYLPASNGKTAAAANAEDYLLAAGWKRDPATDKWTKNGQPLELRLYTNDFLPNARAAEILSQAFREFGVNVSLNILPSSQLAENNIKTRDFDILLFGQKFGADPDPFAFWHSSQINYPGLNLSGFADNEADKLITSARTTTDQNLRQQKYLQLDDLLSEKLPMVFLNQTTYSYAVSSKIKGVSLTKLYDPSSRFFDTANWYIMEDRVLKY